MYVKSMYRQVLLDNYVQKSMNSQVCINMYRQEYGQGGKV